MSQLSQALNASISVLIADADRMSAHLIAEGLTRDQVPSRAKARYESLLYQGRKRRKS